jgi:hypothetical protein
VNPAEVLLAASVLVTAPLARWQRGRPVVVALSTAPLWLFAAAAAGFRLSTLPQGLGEHGVRFVVGWSAHRCAEAAAPLAVAGVTAGMTWLAASSGWRPVQPKTLDWAAAGGLGVAASLVGGSGWWALPAALLAVSPRRPASEPAGSAALASFAAAGVAGAAGAGAEVLSLYTPDGGFAGAAAGAAVALVAAVAAARGPGWWAATPGALVAFLGAAAWREGPHPGLGGRALPAATGSEVPYRVPFGCVVEAGGGVVTLADHRESPECPPRVERFPAGRRRATPLFALPPEAPIEETWPAAGGEVALLAQWPGTGRSRWGVIRIDATVLAPPGEAAPGAVPPVNLLVTDPQGRAPAGAATKLDVVLPRDAAPDVGAFVAHCARLRRELGPGARCAVGTGDPARWR